MEKKMKSKMFWTSLGVTNMVLGNSIRFSHPTPTLFRLQAKKLSPLMGSFLSFIVDISH
jgi:hypothetical protein